MNKLSLLLTLLLPLGLGLVPAAQAQVQEKYPPPTEPLLRKAPAMAEWSLVTKINKDQEAPKYRILHQMNVTKGAQRRRIISRWSNGQTTERWVVKQLVLSEDPGNSGIQVYDSSQPWFSSSPRPFPNYAESDFPELNWITMSNYVGVGSYQGKPCYTFRRTETVQSDGSKAKEAELEATMRAMDGAFAAQVKAQSKKESPTVVPTPSAPGSGTASSYVAQVAFLDVSTQLPLAVVDTQTTQEYRFSSAPPAEPVMPERFSTLLKSTEDALASPFRRK